MLGDAKVDELGNVLSQNDGTAMYLDKDTEDHEINVTYLMNCDFPFL